MKAKIIDNVIVYFMSFAILCLIGGGRWWGGTATSNWFGNWARGEKVRHEWHPQGRGPDFEAGKETTTSGVEVNVLWEVHLEDANDPDGETVGVGDWGGDFKAGDAAVGIVKPPQHGTATVADDGTLTYAADQGYVGPTA
ncbi:hypothetical protein F0344_05110 [Streptomyces finlayi]|uniref:Uncharacterized protein n=1 Tax=Streptomyces finlayi TaxID=67296 RepID=A0A7G7BFF0_9ACTN|nr:Ig-like domain-containing protein [Streptomyces finlayi]QNE74065.1 hypothetical protein F0344_05110 [Streptomyces finlayi]